MPELPEVETIVRGLSREIRGRTVAGVEVRFRSVVRGSPDLFSSALAGARVEAVDRHGKSILIRLARSGAPLQTVRVHLGMTGQLLLTPTSAPLLSHTHVIFRFEGDARDLRFRDMRRFGWMELLAAPAPPRLGPDAWAAPPEIIYQTLRARRGMLKHALLNQSVVAGLGNIYVDEALFLCRLHPRRELSSLSSLKLRELCGAIRDVLRASIDVGGTSFRNYVDTAGARGGFKGRLRIYGRTGHPCSCGRRVRRIVVAGRGTHICSRCQPAPRGRR